MNRCRCGVWTDYGMTCVACRQETYRNMRPPPSTESEGELNEVEEETEDEEIP